MGVPGPHDFVVRTSISTPASTAFRSAFVTTRTSLCSTRDAAQYTATEKQNIFASGLDGFFERHPSGKSVLLPPGLCCEADHIPPRPGQVRALINLRRCPFRSDTARLRATAANVATGHVGTYEKSAVIPSCSRMPPLDNAPMKTARRAWPIAAICFQAAGRGAPPIRSAPPAAMPRHCRRGT
jgi:hypothetical protein